MEPTSSLSNRERSPGYIGSTTHFIHLESRSVRDEGDCIGLSTQQTLEAVLIRWQEARGVSVPDDHDIVDVALANPVQKHLGSRYGGKPVDLSMRIVADDKLPAR